jgi:inner membrane protein
MDTLTHIVLGACIGEAIAGKQLGKKALFLGAFAQSIPDLDFIASFWLPTAPELLAHRGFTHSFLFVVIFSPLLALASGYLFKLSNLPYARWLLFWGLQIFIHDFIDAFNAYGTGWFEPFSHYRVSFNAIFVADPLFSIWPAAACIALLLLKNRSTKRKQWAVMGIGLSSLYLLVSIAFKQFIDTSVKDDLQNRHVPYKRYFTTPTPLNNLLWYIIAETDSGYYIGYRSVFDKTANIDFHYDYRNDSLLAPYKNTENLNHLLRFSNGYYVAELWHDTLVFNDLRFGEITGWSVPQPRISFHYFLQYPGDNKMIVQRGRFAGWNKETLHSFLKRIKGN